MRRNRSRRNTLSRTVLQDLPGHKPALMSPASVISITLTSFAASSAEGKGVVAIVGC